MFFFRRRPMRIRFYSVRFGLFRVRSSTSVFGLQTEQINPTLLGANPQSLREVPSSRIRFYRVYRGITRVLPRVHTRTKNNNNLPRVLEMAYFWSSFFWIRQVDRRVFVFSTSRERWSNFGKRTAGSVALRAKNEQKLAWESQNRIWKKKDRIEIGLSCYQDTRLLPPKHPCASPAMPCEIPPS